jgi:hypothetical protein
MCRLIVHHARQEISDAARGTDALSAANISALPGGEDRLALSPTFRQNQFHGSPAISMIKDGYSSLILSWG